MDSTSTDVVADVENSDNNEEVEEHEGITYQNNDNNDDEDITYQIIVGGSLRGKCLLRDSKGYTYTSKAEKGDKQWWRCSVRTNVFRCGASVSQVGDRFTPGRYPHEHPPPIRRIGKKRRRAMVKAGVSPESSLYLQHKPDNSMYTCRSLQDDYDDDEDDGSHYQDGDYEGDKSPIKVKIRKKEPITDNNSNADVPDDLVWIEKERLMIEKERLVIEKERLAIEKQRLEEMRNHNSRCSCMNPSSNSMLL